MAEVLIVDDEALIRFSLSKALTKEGLAVSDAENGKSAMEKISRDKYSLAVIDLRLGDVDGIDVIRYLKKISPQTGIIVITAFGSEEVRRAVTLEGIDGFFEKPFDTYEITKFIRGYLSPRNNN